MTAGDETPAQSLSTATTLSMIGQEVSSPDDSEKNMEGCDTHQLPSQNLPPPTLTRDSIGKNRSDTCWCRVRADG